MITQQIRNKPRVNIELTIEECKRLLAAANKNIEIQQLVIDTLQKDLHSIIALCEKYHIDVSEYKKEYAAAFIDNSTPTSSISSDSTAEEVSVNDSIDDIDEMKKSDEPKKKVLKKKVKKIAGKKNLLKTTGKSKSTSSLNAPSIAVTGPTHKKNSKSLSITDLQHIVAGFQEEMEKARDRNEILQDDLDNCRQTLSSKVIELEDCKAKNDEIIQKYDTIRKTLDDKVEAHRVELLSMSNRLKEKSEENNQFKNKIAQLTEQNQILALQLTNGWKGIPDEHRLKELQHQLSTVIQSEEELKHQLDGKLRHIQILEKSLQTHTDKIQTIASDTKKKNLEYEKRIKDLESQLRIIKSSIQSQPVSNIVVPLKY